MNIRGFTVVELMMSIAILGIISAISLPVYNSFQVRNDVILASDSTTDILRRAHSYARTGFTDSIWSVKVTSSSATLYKGNNYASRDVAYDEVVVFPTSLTASGLSDVSFAKQTGLPSVTGSLTLTSSTNEVKTITVNGAGSVTN